MTSRDPVVINSNIIKFLQGCFRPFPKFNLAGLTPEFLERRISQKLISLYYNELLVFFQTNNQQGLYDEKITITKAGVKLPLSVVISSHLKFFAEWVLALMGPFISLFSDWSSRHQVLMPSPLDIYSTDELRFLFEEHLQLTGLDFFSKSKHTSSDTSTVHHTKLPTLSWILKSRISFFQFPTFIFLHIKAFFLYFRLCFSNSAYSVLCRDFSLFARFVTSEKLEIVTRTNSEVNNQELWFDPKIKRNYQMLTIWYSTNSQPIITKEITSTHGVGLTFEFVSVLTSASDLNFVWNERQKTWLDQFPYAGKSIIVGPIIRKNTKQVSIPKRNMPGPVISVFDITPFSTAWMTKFLGDFYNYFDAINMEHFVDDIIKEGEKLNAQILLKHKRASHELHDKGYAEFINKMINENKVQLIDHDVDIFDLIKKSDLVICYPFTSPYYLAQGLGIKTFFYDAPKVLDKNYRYYEGLEIIQGAEELADSLRCIS